MLPNKPIPFVWHFLKKYKFLYFIFVFLFFIVDIVVLFGSNHILKLLIDTLSLDNFPHNTIYLYAMLFAFFKLFSFFTAPLERLLQMKTIEKIKFDISNSLFAYILKHSLSFFDSNFAGFISSKIYDIPDGVKKILETMVHLTTNFICFFIFLFILSRNDFRALLFFSIWFVAFGYGFLIIRNKIFKASIDDTIAGSKLIASIVDSVASAAIIKFFSKGNVEKAKIKNDTLEVLKCSGEMEFLKSLLGLFNFLMFFLLIIAVIFFSFNGFLKGVLTIGDISSRIVIASHVILWIKDGFVDIIEITEEMGKIKNGLDLLITPYSVENYTKEEKIFPEGEIKIQNVDFKYKDNLPLVFKNFNLTIPSNQKIGIVGDSGAGKSTLINLLLRFYDINTGNITIDGINIKNELTQESLRKNISFIPQEPTLFHRTIKENLLYSNVNATDEEIVEACKQASCYDFIMDLEDGFDTMVGERGTRLSAGQKQRIAIARAILKNSKILILDEATSSLDNITENEIRKALKNLMKNKTVIVIAHRLATLNNMDRIVVIDKGAIKEDGTKGELLKLENGLFKKMWDAKKDGILAEG